MALQTANQFRLTPDVLGSASRGLEFGQQVQQAQLQPQISQLRQQALGGDQQALTQLAGISPEQAQNVQQFQAGQATSEQEAQRRRIESVVKGAVQAQNLPNDESKLAFLKKRRADLVAQNIPGTNTVDTDEVIQLFESGQSGQANALIDSAAQSGRDLGILTTPKAPAGFTLGNQRFDARGKLIATGSAAPKLSPLQQKVAAEGLDPNTPAGQARAREITQGTRTDPSLKPSDQQLLNKATEGQLTSSVFANRVFESNEIINNLEDTKGFNPASITSSIIQSIPGGNIALSDEQQQYIQAKRDIITAVLRKQSGAVIGESEFENEDKKLFPQVGDSVVVKAQKRKARNREFESLKAQSKGVFGAQFGKKSREKPKATTVGRFTVEEVK